MNLHKIVSMLGKINNIYKITQHSHEDAPQEGAIIYGLVIKNIPSMPKGHPENVSDHERREATKQPRVILKKLERPTAQRGKHIIKLTFSESVARRMPQEIPIWNLPEGMVKRFSALVWTVSGGHPSLLIHTMKQIEKIEKLLMTLDNTDGVIFQYAKDCQIYTGLF